MKNKRNYNENKREYYRIIYPLSCRPKIIILGLEYEVVDVSEHGIRFHVEKTLNLKTGLEINAEIIFHDGEAVTVVGKILRIVKNKVILNLSKGIPLKKIVNEQRYLIKNYPHFLK
jgi:hypothetical protein